MTPDPLSAVESALESEGLLYSRDDDDDAYRVAFKSEGDRYFVVSYRDDPNFLMVGSGWAIPADLDLDEAMDVANALNVRKKFVKSALWSEERDALFTIELCVNDASDITPHFGRLLDVLRDTAQEFFDMLREDSEE